MNSLKTNYIIRQVQKEGWDIEVGVCSSDGTLLYIGKSESLLSLRWQVSSQISIYDNAGTLQATGEARPTGKWFSIPEYVIMRDGKDECIVCRQKRTKWFLPRKTMFSFADGGSCLFWCPLFENTYKGESDTGWRYEMEDQGGEWNVSIWGMEDDIILLTALMYSFRQDYFNQFSS